VDSETARLACDQLCDRGDRSYCASRSAGSA
jgi:hypothetical protein